MASASPAGIGLPSTTGLPRVNSSRAAIMAARASYPGVPD